MMRGVPILLYHRVGHLDGSFMDRYTVSPARFAAQMETLHRQNWHVISLRDLVQHVDRVTRDRRVVITFDDGFSSNREFAWPILTQYAFPAATFVVTGMIGTVNSWDGPERAHYPLLSAEELRSTSADMQWVYPHSTTHADLTLLADPDELRRELKESKALVDSTVRGPATVFAYPRGSWNWDVINTARELGYIGACTCLEGLNTRKTHPFLLRRVEVHDDDLGWRLQLKLRFGRDLVRWPPRRPAIVSIAAKWIRHRIRTAAREWQAT